MTIPGDPGEADDSPVETSDAEAALPEAAAGRLQNPTFTSGLTVPEFAACVHMGMRPVGLVQGFCVMSWRWTGYFASTGLSSNTYVDRFGQTHYYRTSRWGYRILDSYRCPHSYVTAEHAYYGYNEELTSMEQAWEAGFGQAHARMLAEAAEAGAHGVVGVIDATKSLIGNDVMEFHLLGTAVVMEGEDPPPAIWTTFLAGQRLAKLFEAGMLPLSVVGAMAAVAVQPFCATELLERGAADYTGVINPTSEILQLSEAQMDARRVARNRVRDQLRGDALHGANLHVYEGSLGAQRLISATLQGTRVRRFADVEPLPAPIPTVRLS